jgi:flagellar hook-associated protein 3 FlgL
MGISRISSTFMVDRGVSDLQNNLLLMNRLQEQISSGRNISNPSDDPVGLTQLLRLNLEAGQDDRYSKNMDDALGELGAADNAITGIVNISQRANELAVQASNATNSADQLNAIGKEIDTLIAQLAQMGNTTYAGRYIFSGFMTDTQPFSVAGQDITYNGTPNNVPFEREVEVAQGSTIALNLNGDNVLGNVTVVAGVPSGQGLLFDLTKLRIDISNQDFTNIRAGIDAIKADQSSILNQQTLIGGRVNQMELTQNRIQDRALVQARQISQIQEVDMPEAISNLNFQQTIYQASLGVMARIMQTSLANFLG